MAQTERIPVDPVHPDPAAIGRSARIVREGGIVAFPTETVYGLAAAEENPQAVARLARLKGRGVAKPFTVHLPRTADVLARVDSPSGAARRLMGRYWPGPLTLVLQTPRGQIGFRVPAGAVPGMFLAECVREGRGGILAPSANRGGGPPAVDAEEVLALFGGEIDAVLDGGKAPIGQSSTVVRIAPGALEVLREGIITREQVLDAAACRILFVCTGNSCRSPMAEGILRRILSERLGVPPERLAERAFRVDSAGVAALAGEPASAWALSAARELGADLSPHRTRPLTPALLRASDLVYAMTRLHWDRAVEMEPSRGDRVFLLDPDGEDVPDPAWGSPEVYRESALRIERLIRRRLEMILAEGV